MQTPFIEKRKLMCLMEGFVWVWLAFCHGQPCRSASPVGRTCNAPYLAAQPTAYSPQHSHSTHTPAYPSLRTARPVRLVGSEVASLDSEGADKLQINFARNSPSSSLFKPGRGAITGALEDPLRGTGLRGRSAPYSAVSTRPGATAKPTLGS